MYPCLQPAVDLIIVLDFPFSPSPHDFYFIFYGVLFRLPTGAGRMNSFESLSVVVRAIQVHMHCIVSECVCVRACVGMSEYV